MFKNPKETGQSKGNQENNVGTKWDYQQSSRNYKKESKELKKAISKIQKGFRYEQAENYQT